MKKLPATRFDSRYRAALRLHLSAPPNSKRTTSATTLGHAARALGYTSRDIVRVHDRALSGLLQPARPDSARATVTPPGRFLLAALKPVEDARSAALLEAIKRRRAFEARLASGLKQTTHLLAEARVMRDRLRHLAHRIIFTQEEERRKISRELHDDIAQTLAGINVQLATLKEAAALDATTLRTRITKTQRAVEKSVNAIHRFARELRPALLDDLGLLPALRSFIRTLPDRRDLHISLSAFSEIEHIDIALRTVLYRVTQEALNNVARHAGASHVVIRIQKIKSTVRLEIHDNGKSFPVESVLGAPTPKSLGLIGMRERVEMVGGTFSIESTAGRGTDVRAEIPLTRKSRP